MLVTSPRRNMYILWDGDFRYLQSYETVIARIYCGNGCREDLVVSPDWEYSKTTLSHLKQFIEAYLPELYGEGLSKRQIERLIERDEIHLAREIENPRDYL